MWVGGTPFRFSLGVLDCLSWLPSRLGDIVLIALDGLHDVSSGEEAIGSSNEVGASPWHRRVNTRNIPSAACLVRSLENAAAMVFLARGSGKPQRSSSESAIGSSWGAFFEEHGEEEKEGEKKNKEEKVVEEKNQVRRETASYAVEISLTEALAVSLAVINRFDLLAIGSDFFVAMSSPHRVDQQQLESTDPFLAPFKVTIVFETTTERA